MLHAELDKGSQVYLAGPTYGFDVCTGAIIPGQVAEEAAEGRAHGLWDIELRVCRFCELVIWSWGPKDSLTPCAPEPEFGRFKSLGDAWGRSCGLLSRSIQTEEIAEQRKVPA